MCIILHLFKAHLHFHLHLDLDFHNLLTLNYNNVLVNFYQTLQFINKSFETVSQKLNENEHLVARISLSTEIASDKLAEELESIKNFQLKFQINFSLRIFNFIL